MNVYVCVQVCASVCKCVLCCVVSCCAVWCCASVVRFVVNECMCGYLRTHVASVARERSAFAFIVVTVVMARRPASRGNQGPASGDGQVVRQGPASGGGQVGRQGPASGGGRQGPAAGGGRQGPAPGGIQVASGNPRRCCTRMEPWEEDVYRWRYTKKDGGARVEMRRDCSNCWPLAANREKCRSPYVVAREVHARVAVQGAR